MMSFRPYFSCRLCELPLPTQRRLQEMMEKPNDPNRFPKHSTQSLVRRTFSLLWRLFTRQKTTRPFWYIHPTYLIGYEDGEVEVYPTAKILRCEALDDLSIRVVFSAGEEESAPRLKTPSRHAQEELLQALSSWSLQVARQAEDRLEPYQLPEAALFPALLETLPEERARPRALQQDP